ncbi:MAG: trpF [Herminiimonas sp.]|nr:trpF [Herminiimonas sp.]
MNCRTRIKLCGLSRPEEVEAAVELGADAIGLVFYPASPRYVAPGDAATLMRGVPAFVTAVGLFVNADMQSVQRVLNDAPIGMLQFHGDETVEQCSAIAATVRRPFLRAVRVRSTTTPDDLLKCEAQYRASSPFFAGLLLDAFVDGYGGGGKVFDWSLIPEKLAPRVVLSGGLSVQNVTEAVLSVLPLAVDVSSGIEGSKGVKDLALMRDFVRAVLAADTQR